MPDKLTDNEIVKALECYRGQKLFAFNGKKPEIYIHDILDLINRLQAENERLNNHIVDSNKKVKSEAYKEFAERIKIETGYLFSAESIEVEVDNLLKELVGE